MKLKYAFAGASGRALGMYCKPMLKDFQDNCEIVGIYDINPGRAQQFVKHVEGSFPVYDDFETMIREAKPDRVIVTTVDAFHSDYIIKSLEMGCDVITEKPMTIDATRCRAILEAEKRTGHKVTVTFNYRYAPYNTKIREIIARGEIGEVYSVHFEWLLSRNMEYGAHGTSYFRRWNARMKNSGGLLVHK
ncbi:MAG: Gfo/Idh/MocA family oxidoreductase, partial [Clostridia bacterium]|nr:Gfo/Idh/MocA family oxidoreductase [Clostridia bacterium]